MTSKPNFDDIIDRQALDNLRLLNSRRISVDPACYQLAAAFLRESDAPTTDQDRHDLAADIQQTIEDFLFKVEDRVGNPGEA